MVRVRPLALALTTLVSGPALAQDAPKLYAQGYDALQEDRLEDAEELLSSCVVEDPGYADCWWGLGWVSWKRGALDRTIRLWQQVERISPGHPHVARWLPKAQERFQGRAAAPDPGLRGRAAAPESVPEPAPRDRSADATVQAGGQPPQVWTHAGGEPGHEAQSSPHEAGAAAAAEAVAASRAPTHAATQPSPYDAHEAEPPRQVAAPPPLPPPATASAPRPAAETEHDWSGSWQFGECWTTAAGFGACIDHSVKVFQREGELYAEYDADGYQTMTRFLCKAVAKGDKLALVHVEDRAGNVFAGTPGEHIVTLHRTGQVVEATLPGESGDKLLAKRR